MESSEVVRRERERVTDGTGVAREAYEEGMKVGTLVLRELDLIAL